MRIFLLLLSFYLLPQRSFSKSLFPTHQKRETLFHSFYYNGYRERFCFQNIVDYIHLLNEHRIDLTRAKLIKMTNEGTSVFGFVHAEWTRPLDLNRPPREKNWYYHVILEIDGLIADFDFSNRPEMLSREDYFERMFLHDQKDPSGMRLYAGRERKLQDYKLTITPAHLFLPSSSEEDIQKQSIDLYLKDYLHH